MSDTKLKPCPFCGGEAIVYEDNEYDKYSIGCKNCCDCEPITKWTRKKEAIALWNTRKPMERIVERLEEAFTVKFTFSKPLMALEDAIKIVKEEGGIE